MSKKTSKKLEQEIIDLYVSGKSMAEVGKVFNRTSATVLRILRANNIPTRTKGGINQIPAHDVINRYLQGESCQVIADSYNVSFNTIKKILVENGIPRNNRYANSALNLNYFTQIDTYDKAYFLGFLITDGNIGADNNAIRLSLKLDDIHILETFTKKVNSSNKLYIRKDKPEVTFAVKSQQWKQDLQQFGVIPNKTSSVELIQLSPELMPHFVRGLIDGDGWISAKSHQIGFCGNEKMTTQLRDFLVNILDVYPVKVLHPETNLWQISWAGKKDINKIGEYIYNNKQDCFLERKYQEFIQIHGNTEVTN